MIKDAYEVKDARVWAKLFIREVVRWARDDREVDIDMQVRLERLVRKVQLDVVSACLLEVLNRPRSPSLFPMLQDMELRLLFADRSAVR